MLIIAFERPLTALEIRDPAVAACSEIAREAGLYARFEQPQQRALSGSPGQARFSGQPRKRIGNGKHKDWFINFQPEHPSVSHPTIMGRIALKGPVAPDLKQFGGFDYGKYGDPKPTYSHIAVIGQSAVEFQHWQPKDIDPSTLIAAELAIKDILLGGQTILFDIEPYLVNC